HGRFTPFAQTREGFFMECANCGAANPENKHYCGDCGKPLLPQYDPAILQQVQIAIRRELKDRKLVEIEVTEAIITRLTKWAKLLGYFAGVPLAILIVTLGALGIKNYTDVSRAATAAQQEISEHADQATKELAALEPRIAAIKANA